MARDAFRLIIMSVLLIFTTRSRAEDFAIRMESPSKVGDRAEVSWIATQKSKSTMNYDDREKVTKDDRRIEIEGIEEVRRVDAKGSATRIALLVSRCEEVSPDGAKRAIVAKGRTITLSAGKGDTQYALDSGRLKPEDEGLLRLALHLREEGMPDDDAIFGTKERREVGATWSINSAAMIRRMRQATYDPLDPKQVKGTVKFVGVQDVPEFGRCFHFETDVTIENMTGKSGDGYKLEDGDFQSIDAALIPINGGDPLLESDASQFHQIYTSTYNGIAVRVDTMSTRTIEVHRKPLPPNPTATTQPSTIPSTVPSTRPAPKPLTTTSTTPATKPAATTQVR